MPLPARIALLVAGAGGSLALGASEAAPLPVLVALALVTIGTARPRRAPAFLDFVPVGLFLAAVPIGYALRLHHFTYGPMKFDPDLRKAALLLGTLVVAAAWFAARALSLPRPLGIVAGVALLVGFLRWAWGGTNADGGAAALRIALLASAVLAATLLASRGATPGAGLLLAAHLVTTTWLFGDDDAFHPSLAQVIGENGSRALRLGFALAAVGAAAFAPRRRT